MRDQYPVFDKIDDAGAHKYDDSAPSLFCKWTVIDFICNIIK